MFNLNGLISSLKTSNYHLIERQMVAALKCVRKIQKDSQVSRIWNVHCSHCFALIFSHILRIFALSSFISSHIWHHFFCFGSAQLRLHLSPLLLFPPVVPVFLFFFVHVSPFLCPISILLPLTFALTFICLHSPFILSPCFILHQEVQTSDDSDCGDDIDPKTGMEVPAVHFHWKDLWLGVKYFSIELLYQH